MNTPFDAALRLRQRDIDDLRRAIRHELDGIAALDAECAAIDVAVRAEREIASRNHGISADAFAARMGLQRERLCLERAGAETRLAALRDAAVEAFGTLGAMTAAADRFREARQRVERLAEQSQIDDFSAARFTRAVAAARRLRDAEAA
ncbi:MAG: hypothetical protein ACKVOP_04830 [Sphingomonadaceae bacterium]